MTTVQRAALLGQMAAPVEETGISRPRRPGLCPLRMIGRALLACLLARAVYAQAPAYLVKDINSEPVVVSSSPHGFLTAGSFTFFIAEHDDGVALWRTDGTEPGTVRLSERLHAIDDLTSTGGVLFFLGWDGGRTRLYRTDGTAAATPVVEIAHLSLTAPPFPGFRLPLVAANGLLFFAMPRSDEHYDLWRSDGTAAGTFAVKDALLVLPPSIVAASDRVFFVTDPFVTDPATGSELWTSDGSREGTLRVGAIQPTGREGITVTLFAAVGGVVFFQYSGDDHPGSLWRSDGTTEGTFRLHIFRNVGATSLGVAGGQFYFSAFEQRDGAGALWRSDGTAAGTVRASDVTRPACVTEVDGTVFFLGDIDVVGNPERRALWKIDGTPAGTSLIQELSPPFSANLLTAANGLVFFRQDHALWRSDGTAAGTFPLSGVEFVDYPPPWVTVVRDTVFFSDGLSLWATDGTDAGTLRLAALPVTEIVTGDYLYFACDPPMTAGPFAANAGRLLFASAGAQGIELWQSDGTLAGTVQLANIGQESAARTQSASPSSLIDVSGTLYFVADDGVHGSELWRSDGTAAGTALVRDITAGSDGTPLGAFSAVGDALYFFADDGTSGAELWKSDGTDTGTMQVQDINPGATGSAPSAVVDLNGTLLFTADDGTHGRELWKSDGTGAGTSLVADVVPGPVGAAPRDLGRLGAAVFFLSGTELWRSDGSAAGTARVTDLGGQSASSLSVAGGALFLVVRHQNRSFDIFRSDGTEPGTILLAHIQDAQTEDVGDFAAVDGTVYFVGYWRLGGFRPALLPFRLWRSDGTTSVTAPIALSGLPAAADDRLYFPGIDYRVYDVDVHLFRTDDTAAGFGRLARVRASGLTAVGTRVIFSGCSAPEACCAPEDCEVWESDGTAGGTRRLADVLPGEYSSNPQGFVRSGSRVFFAASNDGATGTELWAVPLDALGRCGNGVQDPGETCDTAGESTTCDADCSAPTCGDGVVNAARGETCDDGNTADYDCCTVTCAAQPSGTLCGTADVCDGTETCDGAGVCLRGTPLDCDDQDPSTADTCDPRTGCSNLSNSTCIGDCSADGRVTIDELVRMVRVALGGLSTAFCPSGDVNGDGRVMIEELVAATANALMGCARTEAS